MKQTVLVKCWICGKVASRECDYCKQPICNRESCRKLVEGLDPGWACTACYVIMTVPQIAKWEIEGVRYARDD